MKETKSRWINLCMLDRKYKGWWRMTVRLVFIEFLPGNPPQAGQPVCIHVCESSSLLCPCHAGTAICCPSKFCPAQQDSSHRHTHTHTTPHVLLVVRQPGGITPNDQRLIHTCCDLQYTMVHQQKVPLNPSASSSFLMRT